MDICAQEDLPKWERLLDDYIQEETRRESRPSKQRGGGGDENLALVTKPRKAKGKFLSRRVTVMERARSLGKRGR